MAINTAIIKMANGLLRHCCLQQIISAPSVSSYISEIETEVGRRAREQKGLGWIKKEENYVMVQFISIRTCQELPDNSSG